MVDNTYMRTAVLNFCDYHKGSVPVLSGIHQVYINPANLLQIQKTEPFLQSPGVNSTHSTAHAQKYLVELLFLYCMKSFH